MVRLFDNTLRDGGNVVGHGFPIALTESIVQALLSSGIADIECGNCKGLGAYDKLGATQAPSDEEYFSALQPYLPQGRIGMFLLAKLADRELVRRAADAGLHFLRVGANAGDGAGSVQAVSLVKEAGLTCRYSLMKGYILSPAALAQEARMLQDAGVDRITIMDSAGTMFPEQAADYVKALKDAVTIPVGFHGHSNLGLSQANALPPVPTRSTVACWAWPAPRATVRPSWPPPRCSARAICRMSTSTGCCTISMRRSSPRCAVTTTMSP